MIFDAQFIDADSENDDENLPTVRAIVISLPAPSPFKGPPLFGSLLGRCRYIDFPSFLFEPLPYTAMAPDARGLVRVFVGQTTYYTTPRSLLWVVYEVCHVIVRFVETMRVHPAGFLYLYVQTLEDRDRMILAMHKRVLFDAHGVWVAQDFEQATALAAFISSERRTIVPMVPLPRESMVVEASRAK